uniref:Protein EARLY FLOWERING 3 n=1 Tax=Lemna minor TaxID=4472 RepID=A0A8S0NLG9_LEMMI|nr:protein EARLY FLOWERING 3 [Lemna minor]
MKRGREEDKVSGPLFPRLHVNDADKGGPRAPPRNKMALYEQFSIPSQRFTSSSSSTLTFSSRHGSSSAPSISSNQGFGPERSSSSSFYMRPQIPPALSGERSQNDMPRVASTPRKSSMEKSEEEDFRVPIYVQSSTRDCLVAERKTTPSSDSRNFEENGRNLGDISEDIVIRTDTSDQDHDDGNLRSSGSSGSTDKIHSSEDGTADRAIGDDASGTLMVDSGEGMDGYNPDNLVGLLGLKHFWKARRAIVNQQRVFALQVFELHRLMNVQKLLAESPHVLLEDASSFHGSSNAPVKSQPVDSLVKPIDPKVNETQPMERNKASQSEEERGGGEVAPPIPLPILPPPGPAMSGSKAGPWPVHVAGNQWLFPVMSATEGLVYKPFYKPENMVLLPPPYSLPPPLSGSVVEQANFFSGVHVSPCDRLRLGETDLQSSTASSAVSRTAAVGIGDNPARVIKVVPRNPKSASESAVRIFQTIQKERQGYDPL